MMIHQLPSLVVCFLLCGIAGNDLLAEDKTDAPTLPRIVKPIDEIDKAFATEAPDRDSWQGDVEDALRHLYREQQNILARLDAIESALIKIKQPDGRVVSRPVPIRQGVGEFALQPGETLTGYQDVISGMWISTLKNPTPRQRRTTTFSGGLIGVHPVRFSDANQITHQWTTPAAPTVSIQTVSATSPVGTGGVVRGRIRIRAGNCKDGKCSR